MLTLIACFLMSLGPEPTNRAAVVLSVTGDVKLVRAGEGPRNLVAREILFVGDRLIIPKDGSAVVAALKPGIRERLKAGIETTISPEGCTPADVVQARSPLPRAISDALREAPNPGPGRAAVVVFRGEPGGPSRPERLTPILGALVLGDRPRPGLAPRRGGQIVSGPDDHRWERPGNLGRRDVVARPPLSGSPALPPART